MKLNSPFVQAIGILIMLAELPPEVSLKAKQLSERMEVSQGYLQKIAKNLKDADLIRSNASKNGGYQLQHDVDDISFLDIFNATEGKQSFYESVDMHPIQSMFISQDLVEKETETVFGILEEAEERYRSILASHLLSEVVPRNESGELNHFDWSKQ
ncbi:MAG: Rrf2 family transcriptional regulator [Enterococcaceae bacterium]|jgi:Rrf2 family protein|nr:Rrf2 family transcriptional regulator [Enterococcaceae bacterium]MCI1919329.1 Rrf2 family transcriptional regulator [Enterococcaceae bacterium]